jgi:CheY-like chemotaxis protein
MKPLVLIADDDADVRLLFRMSLQRDGFDVMEAADGSQALACAFQSTPALILLDAMMPYVDGVEVCRQLKADSRTAAIPVIFVSAKMDLSSRLEKMNLPVAGCLTKPVSLRNLIQFVNTVVSAEVH